MIEMKLVLNFILDDVSRFKELAWANPHLIVSTSDTPVILHDGARYNALHMCAKQNKTAVAHTLLCILQSEAFWHLLYPDDSCTPRNNRINYMLDLYLNTPDKQCGEIPLHIAAKFGFVAMIELLCSHPTTNRAALNFDGYTADDVSGSRCSMTLLLPFSIIQGPFYICCFVNRHQVSQVKFKSITVHSRNHEVFTSYRDYESKTNCLQTNDDEWVLDAYFGPITKQASFFALTTLKKSLASSYCTISKLNAIGRFLLYRQKLEHFCNERTLPLRQKLFLSHDCVLVDEESKVIESFEEFLRKKIRKIMELRHVGSLDFSTARYQSPDASADLFGNTESDVSLGSLASKFANMTLLSSGNESIDLFEDSRCEKTNDRSFSRDLVSRIEDSMMLSCGDMSFDNVTEGPRKFSEENKAMIDSTFGAAEQNLIHSFGEMGLNWSLVGTENEEDSFVTPPSSPVSDFQDAFDIPFVSFCKCSSQVSEQSVEMSVFESLNNILVHRLYKTCASKPDVSISCPLMKAWCETFESKQQLFERAKVVSYFCKICYCVQYDEESEMLLRALKKVVPFQPFCIS